jgi:hypothetical protein
MTKHADLPPSMGGVSPTLGRMRHAARRLILSLGRGKACGEEWREMIL